MILGWSEKNITKTHQKLYFRYKTRSFLDSDVFTKQKIQKSNSVFFGF